MGAVKYFNITLMRNCLSAFLLARTRVHNVVSSKACSIVNCTTVVSCIVIDEIKTFMKEISRSSILLTAR